MDVLSTVYYFAMIIVNVLLRLFPMSRGALYIWGNIVIEFGSYIRVGPAFLYINDKVLQEFYARS